MNVQQMVAKGIKLNPQNPIEGAREVAKNRGIRFPQKAVEKHLEEIQSQEQHANWLAENEWL